MTIEDYILAHIKFIEQASIDEKRKIKAVSGLRRVIFDLGYRKAVDASWFYKNNHDFRISVKNLSVVRWSGTHEGWNFWQQLSVTLHILCP